MTTGIAGFNFCKIKKIKKIFESTQQIKDDYLNFLDKNEDKLNAAFNTLDIFKSTTKPIFFSPLFISSFSWLFIFSVMQRYMILILTHTIYPCDIIIIFYKANAYFAIVFLCNY